MSALSVNPVQYQGDVPERWGVAEPRLDGHPFRYDQGTQTVHLAPEGYYHGQIPELVNKWVGPTYNGELNPRTRWIEWHSAPSQEERSAVRDLLSKHTGLPLADEHAWDEFNLPGRP